jgi:hypothetical protein
MKKDFRQEGKESIDEVENGLMLEQVQQLQTEISNIQDSTSKENKIWNNILLSSKQEMKNIDPEMDKTLRLKLDIIDHYVEEEWIESFKFYLRQVDNENSLLPNERESILNETKSSLYEFSYMADQVDNLFLLDK